MHNVAVVTPRLRLWFLLVAPAVLLGCGSDTDGRPAVWTYVSPAIIQPNCATSSCHSQGVAAAGLDLSSIDKGHTSLTTLTVTRPTGQRPRPMVLPGNPDESRMLHMLRATGGVRRMPPDRPLAAADIDLIEEWILNGATKD